MKPGDIVTHRNTGDAQWRITKNQNMDRTYVSYGYVRVKLIQKRTDGPLLNNLGGIAFMDRKNMTVVEQPSKKDRRIAELEAKVEALQAAAAVVEERTIAERNTARVDQYRQDVNLLAAGLVRVELLKQWSPKLTARENETSLGLLSKVKGALR